MLVDCLSKLDEIVRRYCEFEGCDVGKVVKEICFLEVCFEF